MVNVYTYEEGELLWDLGEMAIREYFPEEKPLSLLRPKPRRTLFIFPQGVGQRDQASTLDYKPATPAQIRKLIKDIFTNILEIEK